jgi:DNA polymerase-1
MAHDPSIVPAVFEAYDSDRVSDTLIREQLIELREGRFQPGRYALDKVAKRRLGIELEKENWRNWYVNLRDKPLKEWPDAAKRYAIDDAIATLDVWRDQGASPVDESKQVRAALWLHLASVWGVTTDPVRVEALAGTLETERDALRSVLMAQGLVRADNTRNMKAVRARIAAAYAGNPPATPTGAPKTDADTCNQSGDDVLVSYGRLGEVNSKLDNYVPLIRSGTVHARYGFAVTGRTTSSPNIQNLPREGGVRECFVPRPGYVFAIADYDGLELRTVAQACLVLVGHSELAKALNAGLDPHLALAAQILSVDYDTALERRAAEDPEIDAARQTAKVANFGFPGGLGYSRFVDFARSSYGVEISEDRARQLKQQWLARWPEFVSYFQLIDTLDRVVHIGSGRVRGGDVPYTEACNAFFQGLGADAAKRAGWLLCRACYSEPTSTLYGSRIVLFCHDEFVIETPDNAMAPLAADELARLMIAGANELLPDVPAKTKPCLARYYSKKAKPVYDEQGVLVPWG